jgi:nucleotide-binding universal stress UspA family protein
VSKSILVGYDPRTADRAPVHFGAAAARFTGAPLVVASVETGGSLTAAGALYDDDLLADCAPAVEEIELELRPLGIKVDCVRLQSTSAARALHETADEMDAGLLVVGSSRRSGAGRVLAGTTALRLMHGAPCPVAVVPASWSSSGPPRTIGVAYVHTPEGREALRGAHALARRAGATLRVMTVVRVSPTMHLEEDSATPSWRPDTRDAVDVEGEHRVRAEQELRSAVGALDGEVPIEVDAFVGDPAETIVDFSDGVDLLVCGSRGYGPARAVLLGSVSARVTAEAHCPVIVLPRGVTASLESLVLEAAAPA